MGNSLPPLHWTWFQVLSSAVQDVVLRKKEIVTETPRNAPVRRQAVTILESHSVAIYKATCRVMDGPDAACVAISTSGGAGAIESKERPVYDIRAPPAYDLFPNLFSGPMALAVPWQKQVQILAVLHWNMEMDRRLPSRIAPFYPHIVLPTTPLKQTDEMKISNLQAWRWEWNTLQILPPSRGLLHEGESTRGGYTVARRQCDQAVCILQPESERVARVWDGTHWHMQIGSRGDLSHRIEASEYWNEFDHVALLSAGTTALAQQVQDCFLPQNPEQQDLDLYVSEVLTDRWLLPIAVPVVAGDGKSVHAVPLILDTRAPEEEGKASAKPAGHQWTTLLYHDTASIPSLSSLSGFAVTHLQAPRQVEQLFVYSRLFTIHPSTRRFEAGDKYERRLTFYVESKEAKRGAIIFVGLRNELLQGTDFVRTGRSVWTPVFPGPRSGDQEVVRPRGHLLRGDLEEETWRTIRVRGRSTEQVLQDFLTTEFVKRPAWHMHADRLRQDVVQFFGTSLAMPVSMMIVRLLDLA